MTCIVLPLDGAIVLVYNLIDYSVINMILLNLGHINQVLFFCLSFIAAGGTMFKITF